MARKTSTGVGAKSNSLKLKNKSNNNASKKISKLDKPSSHKAHVTALNGERIEVDTSTLRGKRALKRMQRKINEKKHDKIVEERQVGIRPEDVAEVLGHKISAKQASSRAFNKAAKQKQQDSDSDEDEKKNEKELENMTPAQRQIYEMKQRALRTQKLTQKLQQQKNKDSENTENSDDDDDNDKNDSEDDTVEISTKQKKILTKNNDRAIAQQRIAKRYETELSSKIKDDVLRNEFAEEYSILKSSLKYDNGLLGHEREAMIEALFDNLPVFKPIPQKMLSMMKARGQNPQTIEESRLDQHRLKVRRLIEQRITKIRSFDVHSESEANDDDDDNDDDNNDDDDTDAYAAAYFSRLVQQQNIDINNDEDEDSEIKPSFLTDIENSTSLVKLKESTKEQRLKERQEMKEYRRKILEERKAALVASEQNSSIGGGDDDMLDIEAQPDIDSEELSDDDELNALEAEEARIVAEKAVLQKQKQPQAKNRLMVLLEDGTWGYRDEDVLDDRENETKPDLSAYVREPKQKKRKTTTDAEQPEKESKSSEEVPIDNDKKENVDNDNIIERFEQFKVQAEALGQAKRQRQISNNQNDESDDDLQDIFVQLPVTTSSEHSSSNEFVTKEYSKLNKQLEYIDQYHETRLDRIRDVQLILGQLCTEILENPMKHVSGGHLNAILQLSRDRDTTIRQLSIASVCTLFCDILPAYRLRPNKSDTHTDDGKQRLSKDVRQQRTYENTLLKCYEQILKILYQNISHGLNLFSAKQHQIMKQQQHASNDGVNTTEIFEKLGKKLEEPKTEDLTEKKQLEQKYDSFDIKSHEQLNGLYTICLKSACRLFEHAYKFNFSTQLARLLAQVLMSDHEDWSSIAYNSIVVVFKADRCHEATLEIVQTLGDICKKKAGDRIRAPLLSVLLEIPFSAEVIQYDDPHAQKSRDAEKKQDEKAKKKLAKPKGVLGAGHQYFMQQMKTKEISLRSAKKAVKMGKSSDEIDQLLAKRNPLLAKAKALQELKKEVNRGLRESAATLSIEERQKLQTKCLSFVFTIFFRYLKQAPTIKTLYSYDSTTNKHDKPTSAVALAAAQALSTGQAEEAERHVSALLAPAQLLSIPKEHRQQVILTQTQLGIVVPPSHHVLSIIMTGIKKFGALINIDLVLDLLRHCLHVIQTATDLRSLPVSSSLLILESIFTLIQIHNNAITIDLAPYYQVLYNIIWQLLPHPEYTFLAIKCVDLSILQRKNLPFRRVAAIVRRFAQIALHLPPQNSLPLLQICSQCCVAHPNIGTIFDNDRLKNASYDLEGLHPDTSEAIATPAWEFTAQSVGYHPFSEVISKHAILSDMHIGESGPKHQGPRATSALEQSSSASSTDRGQLSLTLTTLEMPDETNNLERPQRITRQIAIARLKPLELYTALDISRGGFCPDVEVPDAKKNRKAVHYDWYNPRQWLQQVNELQSEGLYNHFEPSYQSKLMNTIMGHQTPIAFLEKQDNEIIQQKQDKIDNKSK